MKAKTDEDALGIILDGAFRGLELGALVFFAKSADTESFNGLLGYGRINPDRNTLSISRNLQTAKLLTKLEAGHIYQGSSLPTMVAGVSGGPRLDTVDDPNSDATLYIELNDKFAAIPILVAGELKYIALATPQSGHEHVDEQKLRTLSSLCSQASLALERLALQRQIEAGGLQRVNVAPAD